MANKLPYNDEKLKFEIKMEEVRGRVIQMTEELRVLKKWDSALRSVEFGRVNQLAEDFKTMGRKAKHYKPRESSKSKIGLPTAGNTARIRSMFEKTSASTLEKSAKKPELRDNVKK